MLQKSEIRFLRKRICAAGHVFHVHSQDEISWMKSRLAAIENRRPTYALRTASVEAAALRGLGDLCPRGWRTSGKDVRTTPPSTAIQGRY